MKQFFLTVTLTLGFLGACLGADEKAKYTYEGAITGVVCSACKEHVTAALTQKLPGVVSVNVKAGDSAESKKLTVVATSPDVTKESVIAALGSYAKNYKVLSLSKAE